MGAMIVLKVLVLCFGGAFLTWCLNAVLAKQPETVKASRRPALLDAADESTIRLSRA